MAIDIDALLGDGIAVEQEHGGREQTDGSDENALPFGDRARPKGPGADAFKNGEAIGHACGGSGAGKLERNREAAIARWNQKQCGRRPRRDRPAWPRMAWLSGIFAQSMARSRR